MTQAESDHPARWWHALADGRIQCDLCPRDCKLHEGQRGACFVRKMEMGRMVLTTYGRSSGFCIDPIEKKPLNHFYPGTPVLSFGTAGCNLACKFCQNWDISKSKDMDRLMDAASPERIARRADEMGCKSVAYTYNDPVIFAEYAMDTALACRARGLKNVAVTAGFMHHEPEIEFYATMDAANVDLKGFTKDFYVKYCAGELQRQLAEWIFRELGPDVPLHFSAFHPDWKMKDIPPTPPATLTRARKLAREAGLHYVYTGNVHDRAGGTTFCPACHEPLIVRDWYEIPAYRLTDDGHCPHCGAAVAGRFEHFGEPFGARRIPVAMGG